MKMSQKNQLLTLLRTGYTKSNLTMNDLPYFLREWFRPFTEHGKGLILNENSSRPLPCSWQRRKLILDFYAVKKFDVSDTAYFLILNNFENGDAYGTKREV